MRNLYKLIQNAVFPRFCFGCKKEGSLLCDDCFVYWQPGTVKIDDNDQMYFWKYADPIARELICAWKYDYDKSAWETMQRKLRPSLSTLQHFIHVHGIEAIVPIVLHKRKLCERGFDQSVMIAEFLGGELEVPVCNILKRIKATGKQSERSDRERIEFMKNNPFAFAISPPYEGGVGGGDCLPLSILLVDDVCTTGATIKAASEVLKNSGVKNIYICTLAKGHPIPNLSKINTAGA